MKPYYQWPEFIRSIFETFVAFLSISSGILAGLLYASLIYIVSQLFGKKNFEELELLIIAFEAVLFAGTLTFYLGKLCYRFVDAEINEAILKNGEEEFSVLLRVITSIILVLLHWLQIQRQQPMELANLSSLIIIMVILSPILMPWIVSVKFRKTSI